MTKVNRCLTEGRRAFVERLAGIEAGAECDRVLPLVSALADGEASVEDLQALRPHLRTCLACRARLREFRAAPRRVAALLPSVALAAQGDPSGPLRSLFESLMGSLGERGGHPVGWRSPTGAIVPCRIALDSSATACLYTGSRSRSSGRETYSSLFVRAVPLGAPDSEALDVAESVPRTPQAAASGDGSAVDRAVVADGERYADQAESQDHRQRDAELAPVVA